MSDKPKEKIKIIIEIPLELFERWAESIAERHRNKSITQYWIILGMIILVVGLIASILLF